MTGRRLTWDDFRRHYEAMTLGEAHARLNAEWACACVGGPPGSPGGACFCRLSYHHAQQLHRAAHIVAKLIDDASGHPVTGYNPKDPR